MQTVRKGLSFSKVEITDLGKSLLFISLAFAIVKQGLKLDIMFLESLLISAVAVGLGFVLHELAHKYVAQRFGCFSEFRADSKMLWLALGIAAIFRFIFIAPGAVVTHGSLTKKERGQVSAAGPAMNIALALLFLAMSFIYTEGIIGTTMLYGYKINSWIALFNLIPAPPFDGQKIYAWDKTVFFALVIASFSMAFLL